MGFLCPTKAYTQKIFSPYPFQFDLLTRNYNLLNPASRLPQRERMAQIDHNGFNALSNNLSSTYFNLHHQFGKDSMHRNHKTGFFVINDKEGEYLSRVQLMGLYAYSLRLSEHLLWTSGASMGLVNNVLKPNAATGGESALAPDASIGTWINGKNYYGGLSMNQVFNNEIQFLSGTYQKIRHLNLAAAYTFRPWPFTSLKIEAFVRTGNLMFNKYVLNTTLQFKEKLIVGLGYKSANGLIPMVGAEEISLFKCKLGFMFAYRIPTSRLILPGTGNAEILLEVKY